MCGGGLFQPAPVRAEVRTVASPPPKQHGLVAPIGREQSDIYWQPVLVCLCGNPL